MIIHLDTDMKEQSIVERYFLWDRAINVIKAKPLTGTGINTYAVAHSKYDTTENWRVRDYYAHNGYLQLAAETGIPSLACFLLFLLFFYVRGLKVITQLRGDPRVYAHLGILTGLLVFLIFALADTQLHSAQPIMTFWFLAGILIAYQNRNEQEAV